jgi:uncharacterized LabA/DUF88 family protein
VAKKPNHYAFIDAQNVSLGVQALGWTLDFKRFRIYLRDKYGARRAFLFLGHLKENEPLYRALRRYGYELVFKEIMKGKDGKIKGNVDAELVLQAMIEYSNYEQAVIVTSDGDFACLVRYLYDKGKLRAVLSPSHVHCSVLLRRAGREKVMFFDNLRGKLAYKAGRDTA